MQVDALTVALLLQDRIVLKVRNREGFILVRFWFTEKAHQGMPMRTDSLNLMVINLFQEVGHHTLERVSQHDLEHTKQGDQETISLRDGTSWSIVAIS